MVENAWLAIIKEINQKVKGKLSSALSLGCNSFVARVYKNTSAYFQLIFFQIQLGIQLITLVKKV